MLDTSRKIRLRSLIRVRKSLLVPRVAIFERTTDIAPETLSRTAVKRRRTGRGTFTVTA
jgi:hypothetical protein